MSSSAKRKISAAPLPGTKRRQVANDDKEPDNDKEEAEDDADDHPVPGTGSGSGSDSGSSDSGSESDGEDKKQVKKDGLLADPEFKAFQRVMDVQIASEKAGVSPMQHLAMVMLDKVAEMPKWGVRRAWVRKLCANVLERVSAQNRAQWEFWRSAMTGRRLPGSRVRFLRMLCGHMKKNSTTAPMRESWIRLNATTVFITLHLKGHGNHSGTYRNTVHELATRLRIFLNHTTVCNVLGSMRSTAIDFAKEILQSYALISNPDIKALSSISSTTVRSIINTPTLISHRTSSEAHHDLVELLCQLPNSLRSSGIKYDALKWSTGRFATSLVYLPLPVRISVRLPVALKHAKDAVFLKQLYIQSIQMYMCHHHVPAVLVDIIIQYAMLRLQDTFLYARCSATNDPLVHATHNYISTLVQYSKAEAIVPPNPPKLDCQYTATALRRIANNTL